MTRQTSGTLDQILARLASLRFRSLFFIAAALFLLDLAIPDFIPLIDEILLGILTLLFWSWRKPRRPGT